MTPAMPAAVVGFRRLRRLPDGIEPVWLSRPAAEPTMAVVGIPTEASGPTVSREAFVGLSTGPPRRSRAGFV